MTRMLPFVVILRPFCVISPVVWVALLWGWIVGAFQSITVECWQHLQMPLVCFQVPIINYSDKWISYMNACFTAVDLRLGLEDGSVVIKGRRPFLQRQNREIDLVFCLGSWFVVTWSVRGIHLIVEYACSATNANTCYIFRANLQMEDLLPPFFFNHCSTKIQTQHLDLASLFVLCQCCDEDPSAASSLYWTKEIQRTSYSVLAWAPE